MINVNAVVRINYMNEKNYLLHVLKTRERERERDGLEQEKDKVRHGV